MLKQRRERDHYGVAEGYYRYCHEGGKEERRERESIQEHQNTMSGVAKEKRKCIQEDHYGVADENYRYPMKFPKKRRRKKHSRAPSTMSGAAEEK